jgi:transcriptional regulator with GAF, ATPase, and Fis domain
MVKADPSFALELLRSAGTASRASKYAEVALPRIASALPAEYVALAAPRSGRWTIVAESGNRDPLPVELLGEVLDSESGRAAGPWAAVPLAPREPSSEVLLARAARPDDVLPRLAQIAAVLREGLFTIRRRESDARRIRRLEATLEIAQRWNQARELEPLLTQMAEAATRLFNAHRASIFLWDRPTRTLVGRPALGVEGNELRVPDNAGVVGQVIQSGEPRRVDETIDRDQIDHGVDARLGYTTETLLCVPLRGRSGELFGAFELINKQDGPFTPEDEAGLMELAAHAAVALENARDRQQLISSSRQVADQAAQRVQLIGNSPAIEALRSIVRRVADTDLAVLILGENGTGKEVVAQSIHYLSGRREKPFIAVNCAAIPDTLAESELFGHEKGAFTDAHEARQGKFELAAGGTLLLDEIGELTPSCQAKLLRVIEEKVLVRVGGSKPIHTDARVVAATNQDLAGMVRQKQFREDLYFRLGVVTLELPPLRERPGDVMLLAGHFLGQFCHRAGRPVPQFTPQARDRLDAHPWPGNVRELRNLMERLAYLSTGHQIEADELAFILSPRDESSLAGGFEGALTDATTRFQTEYIRRTIDRAGGNMSVAASRLGLHRSNLYRKMRQLGMSTSE